MRILNGFHCARYLNSLIVLSPASSLSLSVLNTALLAKVIGHDRASQDISTEKFSIERQNEIYKYEINIQTIFKRNPMSGTTSSLLGRGNMMLLVPRKSIECQCPKIKLNK